MPRVEIAAPWRVFKGWHLFIQRDLQASHLLAVHWRNRDFYREWRKTGWAGLSKRSRHSLQHGAILSNFKGHFAKVRFFSLFCLFESLSSWGWGRIRLGKQAGCSFSELGTPSWRASFLVDQLVVKMWLGPTTSKPSGCLLLNMQFWVPTLDLLFTTSRHVAQNLHDNSMCFWYIRSAVRSGKGEECQCYPLPCPQCLVHGNSLMNIRSLNEIKLLILCFDLAILKTRLGYQPNWTFRKKRDRSISSPCSGLLQD